MATIIENRPKTGTEARARGGIGGVIARRPLVSFFALALGLSWLAWVPYILSPHGLGVWNIHFPEFLGSRSVLRRASRGSARAAGQRLPRDSGRRRASGPSTLGRPALAVAGRLVLVRAGSRGRARSDRAVGAAVLRRQRAGAVGSRAGRPGAGADRADLLDRAVSEEPGWRDFALPRLQSRFGALGAAAVLGPLWALWHMPLYLSDWGGWPTAPWTDPLVFIAFTITFNVIMIWVFNRTGQSLPLVLLLHVGVNNTISTLWADMYPGITASTMLIGLAILSTIGATLLLVITRGRLGYDPARDDEPTAAGARLVGSTDDLR